MMSRLTVVRDGEAPRWKALAAGVLVGQALVWSRPDRRRFVYFREAVPEAYGPLLAVIEQEVTGPLYTTVDRADQQSLEQLTAAGFRESRSESDYVMSVAGALDRVEQATLPTGYALENVREVPEPELRRLDDQLRQDVPGTQGWEWDEAGFRQETYEAAAFDPELYWIGIHESTGERVAVVRAWNRPDAPRLGLIAVLPRHRRLGIARALLGHLFRTLEARGADTVVTEIDDTNQASRALLIGMGARRVGGSIELVCARPSAPED